MNTQKHISKEKTLHTVLRYIGWILWIAFIFLCFYYRDYISTEVILKFIPTASLTSALILLLLFAIKSVSIFIYCGLIYTATAVIFPLPEALLINTIGTFIMTSIPYWVGRAAGAPMVEKVTTRYPRLTFINALGNKNVFLSSLVTRLVGFFPNDPISALFGAVNASFLKYTLGSLLGMLPTAIAFTFMGTSLSEPSSPMFVASVILIAAITIGSAIAFIIHKRKHSQHSEN